MQVGIREMVGGDLPELAQIMTSAQRSAGQPSPLGENDWDAFRKLIQDETVLVAIVDGKILGFGSVYGRSFLHHLYVHPSYHRKGVGSDLLNACVAACDRPCTLKCLTKSEQAVQFYLSHVWQVIGEDVGPDGAYYVFSLGD